jgi:putative FmdB family regulatory protein
MPLYEFFCRDCNLKFEELVNQTDISQSPCIKCGKPANKQVSSFAPVISGGSPNETIDMAVGREADKRWKNYDERQSRRRGKQKMQTFSLPKTDDGKYMPVMALGQKKDKDLRKDYVDALQAHRKERTEKGIPQFTEMGAF